MIDTVLFDMGGTLEDIHVDDESRHASIQGVLDILNTMMPEKHIQAEVIETVLGGGLQCRFRVTVEP